MGTGHRLGFRALLEQRIPHHQRGVMMASMAQTNRQHPQLRAMQRRCGAGLKT
jgi:uncharacterized protein (DUF305 family)